MCIRNRERENKRQRKRKHRNARSYMKSSLRER